MASMSRFFYIVLAVATAVLIPQSDEGDDNILPDVDAMMTEADETVLKLSKEASDMTQATKDAQNTRKMELVEARQKYERQLAEVEAETQSINAEIETLRNSTKSVRKANRDKKSILRKDMETARSLHHAFTLMSTKLAVASDYLNKAVNTSSLRQDEALRRLQQSEPQKYSMEMFLDAMGSDRSERVEMAMLQTCSEESEDSTVNVRPEELVQNLYAGMVTLDATQDEGEARLKAQFLANFELLQKKKKERQAKRDQWLTHLAQARKQQHDLVLAQDVVTKAKAELSARLGAFHHFCTHSKDFIKTTFAEADAALNGTGV